MIVKDSPRNDVPVNSGSSDASRRYRRTGFFDLKSVQRPAGVKVRLARAGLLASVALVQTLVTAGFAQVSPPVESHAPYTPTVSSLLAALTLDEKLSLAYGGNDPTPSLVGNVGYLPGVPRLGIPPRRDADALGIEVIADATALPARLGLGATFDRQAIYAAGQLVGNEGRALGVDLVYGPQVDITRLPNWTRNNTTYGEDPFLSGQLGIEEVTGIQSNGLMSEVKHFAFYNGQAGTGFGTPGQPTLPTVVDDQTAHEIYLKAYEYPVTVGQPSSIMASYQGFQVTPLEPSATWASDSALTLTTILRGQWDFPGFVLSDYGATHSVHALLSGLDQEFPGLGLGGLIPSYFPTQLKPLVDPSSPSYDPSYAIALDDAVARVLYGYERFGLLDCASPSGPKSGCTVPSRPSMDAIKSQDAATTEMLSEESAVLLKNDNHILPLSLSELQSVAVIGPTARQVMVQGGQGERARGFPDRDSINPLQMLQALAPRGSHFTYAPGIDWIGSVVPASALSPGLTRTESDTTTTQVDTTINYGTSGPNDLKPGVTYTWTGKITVSEADTYYLWVQQSWLDARLGGPASLTITIDGTSEPLFVPGVPVSTYPAGVVPPHGTNRGAVVSLSAGAHTITIVAAIPQNGYYPINLPVPIPVTAPITFRFTWSRLGDTINQAVAAASAAKVALVFADDNGSADSDIVNSLAANQDALIQAVSSANPNTVVVLSTGDPVLMPWITSVKGILEMWYPGQEGGTSTAKLLLGQTTPGGRLPMTWPASDDQTPFAGHPERINGNGTDVPFSEGIYVGYRWYDQQNINPQFCFGYGLSYTQFNYSGLKIKSNQGGLEVSFFVENSGTVQGSEVPQVYVGPPSNLPGPIQVAVQKLVGFERVNLNPGHKQKVTLQVSPLELSYWSSQDQAWVLGAGNRTIHVGGSSRDVQLQGQAVVKAPKTQK